MNSEQSDVVFGIGINRGDGLPIFGTNTDIDRIKIPTLKSTGEIECTLQRTSLLDGAFSLDLAVHRSDGYPFDYHKGAIHFSVRSDRREVGVISPVREWRINREVCPCS